MSPSASLPSSTPSNALPGASVWRRLAAMVYDGFLLFAILFAATALFQYVAGIGEQSAAVVELHTGDVVRELPIRAQGLLFQLYLVAVIAGFYCYFWRRSGQTLGMQAWRLRLDSAAGGRPDILQCLRRLAVAVPALLLGGAGYWWIWLDRDHLAWHDRLSNTQVVVLPKS